MLRCAPGRARVGSMLAPVMTQSTSCQLNAHDAATVMCGSRHFAPDIFTFLPNTPPDYSCVLSTILHTCTPRLVSLTCSARNNVVCAGSMAAQQPLSKEDCSSFGRFRAEPDLKHADVHSGAGLTVFQMQCVGFMRHNSIKS